MSKKILVVDDNQLLRLIMSEMLEHSGFEVRQAGDGAEALQMVEASPPDLIIADYVMPNMDGAEMIRALRVSGYEDIPVLAVAGTKNAEVEMKQAGARMFLDKPIDEPRLISGVSSLLNIPMHQE